MKKLRLLFIDDEPSVLNALGSYFEKLGHEVHRAESGKEGIGLFEQVQPHVTVLDLMMPGMSGMEVLEVLRRQNAVVLMLTGHGEIESAVQAMSLGAESFLQKPVDMPHLVAAVEKAAEKADLRSENRELRAKLAPSVKRTLARLAVLAVLVGAALGIGALIGSERVERPTAPIPIPLDPQDTTLSQDVTPLFQADTNP